MSLAHKGLEYQTVPWRFTEKDVIAFSGSTTVPVLRDGDTVVADSWRIALYLDEAYPSAPGPVRQPGGARAVRVLRQLGVPQRCTRRC